jgi:hypothetical protein
MLHAVPTVRIYRSCPLRAVLSMELPERNHMLFLGLEGGFKDGAILSMEFPEREWERNQVGAVPWN